MAEDRKRMLEALAAKRKAEAAGGGRQKASPFQSKMAPTHKSSSKPSDPKPSSLLKPQKHHHHHKKASPPKMKKKRVEKYDTEDDDEDESDDEDSDSDSDLDEQHLKKKKKLLPSKPVSASKSSSLKPSLVKGGQEKRGKPVVKEPAKAKRKSRGSSDDEDGGSGDEDEEAAGPDSGDEGLDAGNILPSRTRRHNAQPVHYDLTNLSGDDDDDSD